MFDLASSAICREEHACRFCGGDRVKVVPIRKWQGPPVFRCPHCLTEFIESSATREEDLAVDDLYDEFSAGQRGSENWPVYTALARNRLSWQLPLAFGGRDFSCLSFLDIGCGSGHLLTAAKELGFRHVIGVDADAMAVSQGQARGLHVHRAFWPVPAAREEKYDFISLVHSLEHMPFPGEALQCCLDCLAQNGVISIDVPDQGSLPAALKRVLRHTGRRPDHYAYLQPPWHLSAFRLRSFEAFASKHRLSFVWKRRTSPLDKNVFPHTDAYWSGRFRWNRRVYALARLVGQGGHISVGLVRDGRPRLHQTE